MKIYTKHQVMAGEMAMYEILNRISGKYNSKFGKLMLPKALSINHRLQTLSLPFYHGQVFNGLWNEATGGALLKLSLSKDVPQIIQDLSKIDISPVQKHPKLKRLQKVQFNHHKYQKDFAKLLKLFCQARLITKAQAKTAAKLVQVPFSSNLILNNGDFYPRNFIKLRSGKIVLIDWETWNNNSRANVVDYLENVAAYCFVHMWGNPKWQKHYVKYLRQYLPMTLRDFQKALLIKSAEMAYFWFGRTHTKQLCLNQIGIFKKALSEKYIRELWQ
jgi:hypothetical protein